MSENGSSINKAYMFVFKFFLYLSPIAGMLFKVLKIAVLLGISPSSGQWHSIAVNILQYYPISIMLLLTLLFNALLAGLRKISNSQQRYKKKFYRYFDYLQFIPVFFVGFTINFLVLGFRAAERSRIIDPDLAVYC